MMSQYIKDSEPVNGLLIQGLSKKMEEAGVLLHPSFRDGGSWSIMEAMSFGLPVVYLDTSGPKDMVTENCGIMVALDTPDQILNDIGRALLHLSKNDGDYERMSANASKRIRTEYNWKTSGRQVMRVYEETLRQAGQRFE